MVAKNDIKKRASGENNLLAPFFSDLLEAGCDEAGRGCLAGPVCAAAVILPREFSHPLLNDSKQMSEKNRYLLREVIETNAIAWAVEMVSPQEIDKINILRASFTAMCRAVEKLSTKPEMLLIDGNRFYSSLDIPYECFVGGDARYASIAAASVLAKTYRDDYMLELHKQYPIYDWSKNKGYPTKAHKLAIEEHGVTDHHRMSFNHSLGQLKLF